MTETQPAIAAKSRLSRQASTRHGLHEVMLYGAYVLAFGIVLRLVNPVLLKYDDGWFLLVTYSWLNELGFTNFWVNPIASGIYNWHGFLQPMLLAALSPCGTFDCINFALVALGVVYMIVWYAAVATVATSPALRWALYVIGVGAVLQFSARPELVASLALIAIAATYLRFHGRRHAGPRAALAGGLVGLIAVTSPAAGILAGFSVAAATTYCRRHDMRIGGFLLEGAGTVLAAVAVAAILLLLAFPYDLMSWVEGIREHTARNAARAESSGFIKYHLLTKLFPLQAAMFIPFAGLVGYGLKAVWNGGNRPLFAANLIASACLAYFVYYSAIRVPATFYNFSFLIPAIALAAVLLACHLPGRRLVSRAAFTVPIVLFAAACGFAQLVWAGQKLYAAPDRQELSQRVAEIVDDGLAAGRHIAMDPPLAVAVDDPQKLKEIQLLFFGMPGKWPQSPPEADVLLRAQTELGPLPAEVPGFRLVEETFLDNPLARFVKPEGLYFAIYEPAAQGP